MRGEYDPGLTDEFVQHMSNRELRKALLMETEHAQYGDEQALAALPCLEQEVWMRSVLN